MASEEAMCSKANQARNVSKQSALAASRLIDQEAGSPRQIPDSWKGIVRAS
jgi:hypothetical protein